MVCSDTTAPSQTTTDVGNGNIFTIAIPTNDEGVAIREAMYADQAFIRELLNSKDWPEAVLKVVERFMVVGAANEPGVRQVRIKGNHVMDDGKRYTLKQYATRLTASAMNWLEVTLSDGVPKMASALGPPYEANVGKFASRLFERLVEPQGGSRKRPRSAIDEGAAKLPEPGFETSS